MKILIKQGEYLWNENGTHILDEKGFAITTLEDVEVDIAPEHYNRVLEIVESERALISALEENINKEQLEEESEEESEG